MGRVMTIVILRSRIDSSIADRSIAFLLTRPTIEIRLYDVARVDPCAA